MILTGEHYGALSFSSLDDFYPLQRRAAAAILAGVHAVAARSVQVGGRTRDVGEARPQGRPGPDDFDRPHHAFVIDGERGTGKTTLLLTLEKFLSAMTLDCGRRHPAVAHDSLMLEQLASLDLRAPPGASGAERVALVLPIVFMEDMEATETTMEAVFAQMDGVLEREHARADAARKEVLGKLRDDLRREVGVAWTYSRRIGSEALSNDALDYTDFVVRRAKHNRQAYDRIQTWRGYVTRYLDELGFRTLVLMFDDSDLNPMAAEDILGAIRMYLSHPRVVSVVAVEMATLERTVFSRNISALGETPARLLDFDADAAQGMVDGARSNAVALLDKVLPVNLRHRLLDVDMRHLDHFFREHAEGGGVGGYTRWCVGRFEAAVEPRVKLAWSMLAKPYRRLVADNVRRIVAFKDEAAVDGPDPVPWLVRNHGTHALPMSDGLDLHELETRIEAGEIGPDWTGEEEDDDEDSPLVPADRDLTLIEFWLDLAIAAQHLDVVGSELIRHWLPSRGVLGSEEALLDDAQKSLGVAGILRDVPVPRNCLYLFQFRRLSGVLFHPLPERTRWTGWLEFTSRDPDREAVAEAAGNVAHGIPSNSANVVGWLRSQAVLVTSNTYRRAATLSRPAMELVVGLYALGKAGADAPGLADVLSALEDDERHVVDASLPEHADVDDFHAFLSRLSRALGEGERTRQEALLAWACALEIAVIGDDDQRPRRPPPRRHLAVSFAPTSSSPRLPDLVRLTVDRLSAGGRHALLLAWSLGPLLPVLHGFGGDYGERSAGVMQAWQELSDAFRLLRATVSPYPERRTGAPRAPGDPRGRAAPVAGSWDYPEFTQAALDDILADVADTARRFKGDLRPDQAAGTAGVEEHHRDPLGALASVLGTSRRWVAQHVVRA